MTLLATIMTLAVTLGLGATGEPLPPKIKPAPASPADTRSTDIRSADSPIFVQTTPVRVPAGGTAEAIATCPAGTSVFGGGESNPVPGTVVLTRSTPWRGTWQTTVRNHGSSDTTFTGYAVCGSGLTEYREVYGTAVSVAPNGGQAQAYIHCPVGMWMLGGGQWISGPLNVSVDGSAPFRESGGHADYWVINVRNDNAEVIGIQPVAICGSGLTTQLVRGDGVFIDPGQYKPVTSTCPAGTTLLGGGGGGWHDPREPGMTITDSYRSAQNSWTVYASSHPANSRSRTIFSTAICAS